MFPPKTEYLSAPISRRSGSGCKQISIPAEGAPLSPRWTSPTRPKRSASSLPSRRQASAPWGNTFNGHVERISIAYSDYTFAVVIIDNSVAPHPSPGRAMLSTRARVITRTYPAGYATARNRGLDLGATYDYLVFIDDDENPRYRLAHPSPFGPCRCILRTSHLVVRPVIEGSGRDGCRTLRDTRDSTIPEGFVSRSGRVFWQHCFAHELHKQEVPSYAGQV